MCVGSPSHGADGGGGAVSRSSPSPLKWNEAHLCFWGGYSRKIRALLILLSRLPREGGGQSVGRYYEEWWAGVGGSLRCKVLHLVPHWAGKRWGPNRWWSSPSETSLSLSVSSPDTQFQTVWASVRPLISSTSCFCTEHEIFEKYSWCYSNDIFYRIGRWRDFLKNKNRRSFLRNIEQGQLINL